jgi:hypothetical protein
MGTENRDGTGGKTCQVEQIWTHPDWNANTKSHDVALVKMNCSIDTTERIRPVALAKTNDALLRTKSNELVVVSGFGSQLGMLIPFLHTRGFMEKRG